MCNTFPNEKSEHDKKRGGNREGTRRKERQLLKKKPHVTRSRGARLLNKNLVVRAKDDGATLKINWALVLTKTWCTLKLGAVYIKPEKAAATFHEPSIRPKIDHQVLPF
jgi:hypothetical protein